MSLLKENKEKPHKKRKKRANTSIKTKIFSQFILFAIVLLAILWFFQIVYMESFYKYIKKMETQKLLDYIEETLRTEENPTETIEKVTAFNNMAVYITDVSGNKLYNAEYIVNSQMSSLPKDLFDDFYKQALENGGEASIEYKGSQLIPKEELKKLPLFNNAATPDANVPDAAAPGTENMQGNVAAPGIEKMQDNVAAPNKSDLKLGYTVEKQQEIFRQNVGNEMAESIIYVRIVNIDDVDCVIMVNSVLTPIDATVSTLTFQLQIISIVFIGIALLMAFFVSRLATKSIINTNESAKELGKGNYAVEFTENNYLEIAQLSDTLNYAARELEKTENLQKELIANVSHDLRTPLTMIKAYAEVMRDLPGENTPENVQVIIDETERLSGLVNDMLEVSRLSSETISLDKKRYNLTESIASVMERYQKLKEQDGYVIDFMYDKEAYIYADESKMFQVIYNLVNNAINYTGDDKRVEVRQIIKENCIRIEVVDTGEGIEEENLPQIWDRYYKIDKEHKRSVQGSGLGLSIVKKILDMHDARYGVDSQIGKGTTFWFEI